MAQHAISVSYTHLYEFVDAAEVIFFDEDGSFDAEQTNAALAERLKGTERAVIPGFYGAAAEDVYKRQM